MFPDHPTNCLYKNGRVELDVEKKQKKAEEAEILLAKEEELRLINERSMQLAIDSLKADGTILKYF